MKFIDEYRDVGAAQELAKAIARAVTRPWVIMEVCGGQTHTIVRYGLDHLLPAIVPRDLSPAKPGFTAAPSSGRRLW